MLSKRDTKKRTQRDLSENAAKTINVKVVLKGKGLKVTLAGAV